jgi:hypothetical protein
VAGRQLFFEPRVLACAYRVRLVSTCSADHCPCSLLLSWPKSVASWFSLSIYLSISRSLARSLFSRARTLSHFLALALSLSSLPSLSLALALSLSLARARAFSLFLYLSLRRSLARSPARPLSLPPPFFFGALSLRVPPRLRTCERV